MDVLYMMGKIDIQDFVQLSHGNYQYFSNFMFINAEYPTLNNRYVSVFSVFTNWFPANLKKK